MVSWLFQIAKCVHWKAHWQIHVKVLSLTSYNSLQYFLAHIPFQTLHHLPSQPSLPNPLHILIFHSSQLLNPSHIQHCAMLCKCPWTDLPPEFCLHFSSSTISPRSSSSSSHIYITPWDFHLTHTLTNPILCLPSLALNDAHLNGYSDPSGNAPEPPMHYSLDSPSDSTQHSWISWFHRSLSNRIAIMKFVFSLLNSLLSKGTLFISTCFVFCLFLSQLTGHHILECRKRLVL